LHGAEHLGQAIWRMLEGKAQPVRMEASHIGVRMLQHLHVGQVDMLVQSPPQIDAVRERLMHRHRASAGQRSQPPGQVSRITRPSCQLRVDAQQKTRLFERALDRGAEVSARALRIAEQSKTHSQVA
jgi:hypothetical protein